MKTTRLLPLAALLATLAACTMENDPTDPVIDQTNACGAEDMQNLVGKEISVVAAMTFAAPMRIIRPGQMVTMDFQPERLNITVGDDDVIRTVTCG